MSLEHKIEQTFNEVTAPPQLKWDTLAAIEARRAAAGETDEKAEAAASVQSAETVEAARTAEATSHQPQIKVHSQHRSRARKAWWKYALPVAACFALAAVGIIGIGNMTGGNSANEGADASAGRTTQAEQAASAALAPLDQAVAYVGIDVNPSLELALSDQDIVIAAEAENADAEKVLAGLDLAGLSYEQALATLFASEGMAPYLADDAIVEISVTTDDQALAQTLVAQSDQALAQLPCGGNSQCVDNATREAAHHAGMGVGKYQVATELVELDSVYTMDDCSHMTMRQLHDAVDHHHSQIAAATSTNTSQGQGYGQAAQGQGYAQTQSTPQYGHHYESHGGSHHYE